MTDQPTTGDDTGPQDGQPPAEAIAGAVVEAELCAARRRQARRACVVPVIDCLAALVLLALLPPQSPEGYTAADVPWWYPAATVLYGTGWAVAVILVGARRWNDDVENQRWRIVTAWIMSAMAAGYAITVALMDVLGARAATELPFLVVDRTIGALYTLVRAIVHARDAGYLADWFTAAVGWTLWFAADGLIDLGAALIEVQDSAVFSTALLAAALLALAAHARLAWWSARPDPLPSQVVPIRRRPRRGETQADRPVWTGSTVSPRSVRIALEWCAVAVLWFLTREGRWQVIVLVAVFIGAALVHAGRAWTVLRVDQTRLEIRQPLLRRTVLAVDHVDIDDVDITTFDPTPWSKRAHGVIRRGRIIGYRDRPGITPALRLSLTAGYELLLTMPAAVAVAAQRAVLSASSATPPS